MSQSIFTQPATPANTALNLDLHQIRRWAFQAGKIAMRYFDEIKSCRSIPAEGLAGQADVEIEEYLKEQIQAAYPEHALIGEEGGGSEDMSSRSTIWTIDPLDGTTVFNQGMVEWGIALGVLHQGQPVFGLFYMPATQEMFYTAGSETICDTYGQPLHLALRSGWGHKGFLATTASAHALFNIDVRRTRAPGSVGVNLVYTARGTAAAAFLPKPCLWDLVPGAAILDRVGGVLRYLSGAPVDYLALVDGRSTPEPILAGSPALLADLQLRISPRARDV
jgi:myo-inositol-1(or 4)-monophosphatase